ncbi:MAG: patatin-like phospholipase family protein [Candidatus Comchoanobacterales bacterium]
MPVVLQKDQTIPESIHFCGAGWRLFYYLGFCHYLQGHCDDLLLKKVQWSGASVGAWMGLMMFLGFPAELAHEYWMVRARYQRSQKSWQEQIFTGKSMTQMFMLLNVSSHDVLRINNEKSLKVFINKLSGPFVQLQFKSIEDLHQALMASAFIPLITQRSLFYRYQNGRCFDGMWRNPHHEPDLFVSIDAVKGYNNVVLSKKIGSSFYPPIKSDGDALFSQGFNDACYYFSRKKL